MLMAARIEEYLVRWFDSLKINFLRTTKNTFCIDFNRTLIFVTKSKCNCLLSRQRNILPLQGMSAFFV